MTAQREAIEVIYERLDVTSATEIELRVAPPMLHGRTVYLACAHERETFVERPVAARLRAIGATFRGDVARDPCPVA